MFRRGGLWAPDSGGRAIYHPGIRRAIDTEGGPLFRITIRPFILICFSTLCLLLLLLAQSPGRADTLIVQEEGEYSTIQEAVDAALEGDLIRVYEGLYFESIIVDKPLDIVGNGSLFTNIEGDGSPTIISVVANGVNLTGLTILGGEGFDTTGILITAGACNISDNQVFMHEVGVLIDGGGAVTLYNNTFLENVQGIQVVDSDGNLMVNNTIFANGDFNGFGIRLSNSDGNELYNNSLTGAFNGLIIDGSDLNRVVDNNLSESIDQGLLLLDSNDTVIRNNTFIDNRRIDISFRNALNATLADNSLGLGFMLSGDRLEDWNSHTIDDTNLIQGQPVFYCKDQQGCVIPTTASQMILANVTDTLVADLSFGNLTAGLLMAYSSNVTIDNNTFSHDLYGIHVTDSDNITVSDNICSNNSDTGILIHAPDSVISDNRIHDNGIGIDLGHDNVSVLDNRITANQVNSNPVYGIYLNGSGKHRVENNTLLGIDGHGIYLLRSNGNQLSGNRVRDSLMVGIQLLDSHENLLSNNSLVDNPVTNIHLETSHDNQLINNTISMAVYGILLDGSDRNNITLNNITLNRYGIFVEDSSQDNRAWQNHIVSNTEFGVTAVDNGGRTMVATRNWWGNDTGPFHEVLNQQGEANKVSDDVDFYPWFGSVRRVHNLDLGTDYYLIQDAIDEANPGDRLRLDRGYHYENLLIDRALDIVGDGPGNTTLMGVGAGAGPGPDPRCAVLITGDGVNLSGISIEADIYPFTGVIVSGDHTRLRELGLAELTLGLRIKGHDNHLEDSTLFELEQRNTDGIVLTGASDATLQGNTLQYNGISIEGELLDHWNSHSMTDNTVMGGSLRYGVDNQIVDLEGQWGQVILANYTDLVITGREMNGSHVGVSLVFSSNVTFTDNRVTDCGLGYEIIRSRDILIGGYNEFANNSIDVRIDHSRDITVLLNNFSGPSPSGMLIEHSQDITVLLNNFLGPSPSGLLIEDASRVEVRNNTFNQTVVSSNSVSDIHVHNNSFYDIGYGLALEGSVSGRVHHNHLYDSGMRFYGTGSDNEIFNNTFHGVGKLLLEGLGHNRVSFNSLVGSWIHLTGTTRNNTLFNNTVDGGAYGLLLEGYGYDVIFNHSIIATHGIHIVGSTGTTLFNNTLRDGDTGLHIRNARELTIRYCAIASNILGIHIEGSQDIHIDRVHIHDNDRGIYATGSGPIDIHNSNIHDNRDYGLSAGSVVVNATMNYWGARSGPWNYDQNPNGEGNKLQGLNVIIKPWLKTPLGNVAPVAFIDMVDPDPGLEGRAMEFQGHGVDDGDIRRYAWVSSIDGEFYNDTQSICDIHDLSSGNHSVTLTVMDEFGVWSEPARTWLLIYGKPTASIDNLAPAPAFQGREVRFEGHGTGDGEIVRYRWKSDIQGLLYNGTGPEFILSNLTPGRHTLSLQVESDLGLWSEPVTGELQVLSPPTATITSITPGSARQSREVVFTAQGAGDGAIAGYIWSSNLVGELYNGSSVTYTTSNLSAGNHLISLRVFDVHGQMSEPATRSLHINGRPIASIRSITPEPALFGELVNLIGTATDDGVISRYVWSSDIDGVLSNGSRHDLTLDNLSSGRHTLEFQVRDGSGYWSEPAKATLFVNLLPSVVVNSPKGGKLVFGTVLISGVAYDEIAFVEMVEVSVNDGPWQPVNGTTEWTFEWNTQDLDSKRYTLRFRSFDGIDHSREQTLVLVVDNDEEDDDGGSPAYIRFVGLVIIGIGIALGALVWSRRSKPGHRAKKD